MSFYTFLPKLLNMSLTASVVIVFVLLLRLLLKRAPKVISYALWGIVLIRLLCPVSIESNFSLFGLMDAPVEELGELTSSIEYVPNNIVHTEYPTVVLQVPGVSDVINDALPQGEEQLVADPLEGPIFLATYAWIAGVLGMAIYAAVSYVRLRRKLFTAIHLRDNIWSADGITSPFVMGLFRPKIYLPNSMEQREQSYIILHEQCHIRRFDHVIKAIGFVALCIHWFNPLVWVAFIMAGKDMEMSCDEAVVKKMGESVLADYTASLLSLATGKHIIAGMPLAFGEGDTKGRICNLANWKKPTFWVVMLAVIACVILAVCLLTNPVSGIRNPWVQEYVPGTLGILGTVDKDKFESISEDFAIGADEYGRAVFKDPYKAFDTMVEMCAEGLALIQESNDLSPISRNHYAAYKALGWQMTSGPESAQEQAAFITKFLDIYENSFEKEPPAANTEIPTAEPTPRVQEWFDYLHSDELPWSGRKEINVEVFPDVTFRWMPEKVEAIVGDEIKPLYTGMPVWNVFFTDLTGDGLPELCSTLSIGYGMIDNRIIIYDYANGVSYELQDRGNYDYSLSLQGDRLMVTKRVYNSEEIVDTGYLAYEDETVTIIPFKLSSMELIPGTTYVSYQCIYMNPLSSYAAFGGDSGCIYTVGKDFFATVDRNSGAQNLIDVQSWEWKPFPYTDEEWAALYIPEMNAISNISEVFDGIQYLPLTAGKFLMRVDSDIWIVELKSNSQMGTYLWSIYSLIPEKTMGEAQWEFAPALSFRSPVFEFKFDVDYTEISAVCDNGQLVEFNYGNKQSPTLTVPAGESLHWSPSTDEYVMSSDAVIHFTIHNGDSTPYHGTLYIEATEDTNHGCIYTASLTGTGLHLSQNGESNGGVISLAN